MLTDYYFAKAFGIFVFFLVPIISWSQCPLNIQHPSTKLVLNYAGQTMPLNLDKIDVAFPELVKNNIDVTPVPPSWQTVGTTDFTGVTLTGDMTIYYTNATSEICNYINGEYNDPLPVELNSFEGKLEKNDIYLSWTTLSENQNAGFEIERSFDGERFETIESVTGAGTTADKQNYNFTDFNIRSIAMGETVYYRLKQIDFDGKSNYSPVVSIDLKIEITGFKITKITGWNSSERLLKVYFHNPAQIWKIHLQVADLNGRTIKNQAFYPTPGLQYLELDLSHLKEQLYFISLNNGKEVISKKIVLTRL